jgi:hypothetical protein
MIIFKRLFLFMSLAFILLPIFSYSESQEIISADRRIDWSSVGIPGGIPDRATICTTIDSTIYGNGATDATATIQDALGKCPDNQVVYLPAGTYMVSKTIFLRSYDTLRGAGPGLTILKHTGSDAEPIIGMDNVTWGVLISSPQPRDIVHAVKDAQVVTLSDVSGITSGDLLLLNQLNDGDLVTAEGTNGHCPQCGLGNGYRSLAQLVEVNSINGNQVYLKQPLHWTYNTALTPWAYWLSKKLITRWAGLENMTLASDSGTDMRKVYFYSAEYCWVRNVEVTNIVSHGIRADYCLQCEFRDNYIHGAFTYDNNVAYGVSIGTSSSNNLIENNILDTLTAFVVAGLGSGNVFAYNYMNNLIYDTAKSWMVGAPIINHGAHPKMNLWEGNSGYMVQSDFVWGSGSHNTIFRSRSTGWMNDTRTQNNAAIRFAAHNRFMNVVGNVLGTTGKSNVYEVIAGQSYSNYNKYIWVLGITDTSTSSLDTQVASTLYRHGNYDYVTNSTVWDQGNTNHTMPASLYLNQKPSWWCNEIPWPPIGPDVVGKANAIPAERRFKGLSCTQGIIAPTKLRIE